MMHSDLQHARRAASLAKAANDAAHIASLRIVPRDPCPRCGTRGDVGCQHTGGRQ